MRFVPKKQAIESRKKMIQGGNGKILLLFFAIFFLNSSAMGQNGKIKQFFGLHYPEQVWVVFHPFVAGKALLIAQHAQDESLKMIPDSAMDGDFAGGQIDAFRHAYWMANLGCSIGERKARWLGKAHEKGNKIDYGRKTLEEGNLPDYKSSEMDLCNNEVGLKIAKKCPHCSSDEFKEIVKQAVIDGEMKIIKKNITGDFLNASGEVIPKENYYGLWHTPKRLVQSNFKRPK